MRPFRIYLTIAVVAVACAIHLGMAPPPVPVLLVHDVNPHRPGWDFWTLAPARFRAVLDVIQGAGLHALSLDEAALHLKGRLARERAADGVLITVDDGCASAATVVGPELARRGLKGTFFIVTGWGPPEHVTPDQIRALAAAGHDVGSHSMTHGSLNVRAKAGVAAERARIAAELAGSREKLAEWLGRPVTALAYPKGDWDAVTQELTHEAGYALAFTTDTGYLELGGNPLELPRLQLNWDTPLDWIEAYLTAPRRERTRNLTLLALIVLLSLAAACVARPRNRVILTKDVI